MVDGALHKCVGMRMVLVAAHLGVLEWNCKSDKLGSDPVGSQKLT